MRNSRFQPNISLFRGDKQSKVNILLSKFFSLLHLHHEIQGLDVFLLEADVSISANLSLPSIVLIPSITIKHDQVQLVDWSN